MAFVSMPPMGAVIAATSVMRKHNKAEAKQQRDAEQDLLASMYKKTAG